MDGGLNIYGRPDARKTVAQMMSGVGCTGRPRRVANNTVQYVREDGAEVIRLHLTDIVVKHPDGTMTLNSGGYRTTTTAARIRKFAKVRLWSDKAIWYIHHETGRTAFFDGIRVDATGKPVNATVAAKAERAVKRDAKLKAKIWQFSAKLDRLKALPEPGPGDCWYCCLRTAQGQTLGEAAGSHGHLMDHVREGYLHGSLVYNAMKAKGYKDTGIGIHWHGFNRGDRWHRQTVKRAVRKYLCDSAGIAAR